MMLLNDVDIIKKKELLGVSELSDVEKLYSYNALHIFKERYLLRVKVGIKLNPKTGKEEPVFETVERLDDLFKRVAVAAGIMEVLYDEDFYEKDLSVTVKRPWDQTKIENNMEGLQESFKTIDYKNIETHPLCFKIGEFTVTPFHLERLMSRYLELVDEHRMKTIFEKIIDKLITDNKKYLGIIRKYYNLMANNIFLPNTPALMNAGTKLNQNAACFTLDVDDYMRSISKLWVDVADIFKSGGGIGVNYSKLRPEGAYVSTTGGISSGPISWLKIVDAITGEVKQGGKRRGASMGILNMDHPDIEKFIDLKDNKTLHNHNISICTPDHFFKYLLNGNERARHLMDKITKNVWKTGDPGMIFLENMNSNNLLDDVIEEPIDVTNPCSEISMYPYESCILASINLTKFVNKEGKFDLEKFIDVSRTVTAFLDGIIDATNYPIPEINEMTKKCRRVGTGFMGLADVMTMLKIPYNSKEGFLFAEFISAAMTMASLLESNRQAKIKGAFPLWYNERYPKNRLPVNAILNGNTELHLPSEVQDHFSYFADDIETVISDAIFLLGENPILRNCSVTTIAPTGTLSMFSDCSSALEPNFSNGFIKKVTLGEFEYVNHYLKDALEKEGVYSKQLADKIIKENGGSVQGIEEIPDWIKEVFVTAMDIHPFDHIMMQTAVQRWISNGIAKTINVPEDFDPKLIEYCYTLAWALGNKGTTVYRDNSKDVQVLNNSSKHKVGIQDASYYTYNYIATELYSLPDDYCGDILDACYPSSSDGYENNRKRFLAATTPIMDSGLQLNKCGFDSEIIFTELLVLECKGCGSVTKIEGDTKACYICFKCGNKIGSCE